MSKNPQTPIFKTWWIWNSKTRQYHEFLVECRPVRFSKTPDLVWYATQNPVGDSDRKWMIAEGGSGYVLAFGESFERCMKNAASKFTKEQMNFSQADVRCYIRGHQAALERHLTHKIPGFKAPNPEKQTPPTRTREIQKR